MNAQRFSAVVLLSCSIGFLTGCGSSGTNTHPVPADVYVAGSDGSNAVYWKNGVETVLGQGAIADSIAVSGSNVYVGGSTYSPSEPNGDGSQATIWKNGVPTILSTDFSSVSGITVANGNVYAVGFDENAAGNAYLATIWTNGTPSQLQDGMFLDHPNIFNPTSGSSIFVSGPDIYVSGTATKCTPISTSDNFCAGVAVYWKNGVPTDLTQVTNQGPTTDGESISVSGSDAYVAGSIGQAGSVPSQAAYWINGMQVSLVPGNFTAQGSRATSIAVSGSNIYVSGGGDGYVQGYWTNGKFTAFSTPAHFSQEQTSAIGISGTDVYVAGSAQANFQAGFIATYWKNGVAVTLPTTTGGSNATAIFLVPQQ